MPNEWCAVVGCSNSTKGIKTWMESECPIHLTKQGQCVCRPPFQMRQFPGDPELKELWVKAVNKLDVITGKKWYPGQRSRICSGHFEENAEIPSLNLGHNETVNHVRVKPVKKEASFVRGSKRQLIVLVPPPIKPPIPDSTRLYGDHIYSARIPSSLYDKGAHDWPPTLKLGDDRVKPGADHQTVRDEQVVGRPCKKQKVETEPYSPVLPFSNVMPVPLSQNPCVLEPVDLGRVKIEPEEPVPVALNTNKQCSSPFKDEPVNIGTNADQPTNSSIPEPHASKRNPNDSVNKVINFRISEDEHTESMLGSRRTDSHQSTSSVSNQPETREVTRNHHVIPINPSPMGDHSFKYNLLRNPPINQPATSSGGDKSPKVVLTTVINGQHPVSLVNLGVTSCQTDLTAKNLSKLEAVVESMTRNFKCVSQRLSCLEKKLLDTDLTSEALENNSEKVMFYTGLANFKALMKLFILMETDVKSEIGSDFPKFQEFLMTMIILRLNISFKNLAHRFNCVSEFFAMQIFEKWIDVMDTKLKHLVLWPVREKLQKTMPDQLKQAYQDKVVVIIDYIEVSIDEASLSLAETLVSSDHQAHTSLKFLLGMTLSGIITFVSEAWMGNVSNQHLTENCNIQQNLTPGDFVMTGSEFSINGKKTFCAEVGRTNPSLPGLSLLAVDMKDNPKLEHLRDCVGNRTGVVQMNYQILQGPFLFQGANVDQIVRVCCALNNLRACHT